MLSRMLSIASSTVTSRFRPIAPSTCWTNEMTLASISLILVPQGLRPADPLRVARGLCSRSPPAGNRRAWRRTGRRADQPVGHVLLADGEQVAGEPVHHQSGRRIEKHRG